MPHFGVDPVLGLQATLTATPVPGTNVVEIPISLARNSRKASEEFASEKIAITPRYPRNERGSARAGCCASVAWTRSIVRGFSRTMATATSESRLGKRAARNTSRIV